MQAAMLFLWNTARGEGVFRDAKCGVGIPQSHARDGGPSRRDRWHAHGWGKCRECFGSAGHDDVHDWRHDKKSARSSCTTEAERQRVSGMMASPAPCLEFGRRAATGLEFLTPPDQRAKPHPHSPPSCPASPPTRRGCLPRARSATTQWETGDRMSDIGVPSALRHTPELVQLRAGASAQKHAQKQREASSSKLAGTDHQANNTSG